MDISGLRKVNLRARCQTAPSRLTGQALANAYAACFTYLGKVWATYDGGGWICLRGEQLASHPDLRDQYPNGWSLCSRVRAGEARALVHKLSR